MRIEPTYLYFHIAESLKICIEVGSETLSIWLPLVPLVSRTIVGRLLYGYDADSK